MSEQRQQDVSNRALAIARMIDRLQPGTYHVMLILPTSSTERWTVEVTQSVTIQRRELPQNHGKPAEANSASNA